MVDRTPMEEMLLLALAPGNVNSVAEIMRNPIRDIADIQMKGLESLMWGMFATEGDITRMPAALSAVALERMDDPAKMIRIMITNSIKRGGV